jgi:protein-disulfide isomerase
MHQRTAQALTTLWILTLLLALSLPAVAEPPAQSEPLAEVDGMVITAEEVEKVAAGPLRKLEEQVYNLKRKTIEELITKKLLAREAAKRAMSVQALFTAEVAAKIVPVTEEEIESFYQANKAQLKGDEATAREEVKVRLQNQKLTEQEQAFVQSLRAQAAVVVHLQPMPVFKVEVPVDGAPFKGPETAPVTIVKFEDFACPFCKRAQPTLTEVLSRYGDKVKLVSRDFPLDRLHPGARKAAEAARCANDQGKFWAYHDTLYAKAPAKPDQLRGYAEALRLDIPVFEQCLSSGKYQAAVQQDVEEGSRLGVTGTPTFFINGQMLSGAQPVEKFVQMIEDELARVR